MCEQIPKELKETSTPASRHQSKGLGPYSTRRGKTTMCLRKDGLAQLFAYEGTVDKIMSLAISVSNKYCPSNHQMLQLPLMGHPKRNSGWRKRGYHPAMNS